MSVTQPLPIGFISFFLWKLPPLASPKLVIMRLVDPVTNTRSREVPHRPSKTWVVCSRGRWAWLQVFAKTQKDSRKEKEGEK